MTKPLTTRRRSGACAGRWVASAFLAFLIAQPASAQEAHPDSITAAMAALTDSVTISWVFGGLARVPVPPWSVTIRRTGTWAFRERSESGAWSEWLLPADTSASTRILESLYRAGLDDLSGARQGWDVTRMTVGIYSGKACIQESASRVGGWPDAWAHVLRAVDSVRTLADPYRPHARTLPAANYCGALCPQ